MTSSLLHCAAADLGHGRSWGQPAAGMHPRPTQRTSVAIAHGRRVVRAGLRLLLELDAEIVVVDEAADGHEAVAVAARRRPNVVLVDVRLPGVGCVEATRRMLAHRDVAVMVLTTSVTDARVLASMRAGACGLVFEDLDPVLLVRAVKALATRADADAGAPRRSRRRREIPAASSKVTPLVPSMRS